MKVILYVASTVNGMAAKADGNSDWVSVEDAESFNATCRQAGVVIMGRHTFEIFNQMPFDEWPNGAGLHIVLTSQASWPTAHPAIVFVGTLQLALQAVEEKGKQEVVVVGGSRTFGSFMRSNLVDEIIVDVEPLVFGTGMPMFNAGEFERRLQLIKTKQLSTQTIQLNYKVLKQ